MPLLNFCNFFLDSSSEPDRLLRLNYSLRASKVSPNPRDFLYAISEFKGSSFDSSPDQLNGTIILYCHVKSPQISIFTQIGSKLQKFVYHINTAILNFLHFSTSSLFVTLKIPPYRFSVELVHNS